jgi:hypothetical protein
MKLEFSRQIFEKTQISNLMELRLAGADLFHADGRTETQADGRTERETDGQTSMTKLIVAFRSFANAPKNECEYNVNAQFKFNGKTFFRILFHMPAVFDSDLYYV